LKAEDAEKQKSGRTEKQGSEEQESENKKPE